MLSEGSSLTSLLQTPSYKLCTFVKLEFYPISALISTEKVRVPSELAMPVEMWRIQRGGQFGSGMIGQVKLENNADAESMVGEVKTEKKVNDSRMGVDVKPKKIAPKTEYIEPEDEKPTLSIMKKESWGKDRINKENPSCTKRCNKQKTKEENSPRMERYKIVKVSLTRIESWVKVCKNEGGETINIATENDGNLLLSSLLSQFPGTTGLKFRNPETNCLYGVRCHDGVLFAPSCGGWSDIEFICVMPNVESEKQSKRKAENEGPIARRNHTMSIKVAETQTSDLIIRGLPDLVDGNYVKKYFEHFGEVTLFHMERQQVFSYAFCRAYIKFAKKEDEVKVMSQKHKFHGRWYNVQEVKEFSYDKNHNAISHETSQKDSNYQTFKRDSKNQNDLENKRKIYVGRLPEVITSQDLTDHFERFGRVTAVHIPRRGQSSRHFGFVHFSDWKVAEALRGLGYQVIKGLHVIIG